LPADPVFAPSLLRAIEGHVSARVGRRYARPARIDGLKPASGRYGRAGSYRRGRLVERFGADAALPDVLIALASCDRQSGFSNGGRGVFTGLARAFDGARGSW